MSYQVKELFWTLQGEGAHTGRPAVLCRFAGCNLWSGVEEDRDGAVCSFCDTDFVGTDGPGGGTFQSSFDLAAAIAVWPPAKTCATAGRRALRPFVVFTGGEPLLQLDQALIVALHERGFEIAVETNGTRPVPEGLDWVCVSPKAGARLEATRGQELKLVYPQYGTEPAHYEGMDFLHFFLQPMDGPARDANTQEALQYRLEHPRWKLSLRTHKILGIR